MKTNNSKMLRNIEIKARYDEFKIILDCLIKHEMSRSELIKKVCKKTKWPAATVERILNELVRIGWLTRSPLIIRFIPPN